MTNPRLIFICGLHKSGTTCLAKELAQSSPDFTTLTETGVPADEGQHLQKILLTGAQLGGPGKFAFESVKDQRHNAPIDPAKLRAHLLESWSPYFDHSAPILIEKSPPNLIRIPLLAQAFPDARFIVILRNPIAVSLATRKWSKTSLDSLIRHWLVAHRIAEKDSKTILNRIAWVKFEDLQRSNEGIAKLADFGRGRDFLPTSSPFPYDNAEYKEQWETQNRQPLFRIYALWLKLKYGKAFRRFGYRFGL